MKQRIENTFSKLDRTALVTFLSAGDPDHATSLALFTSLPGAGADIVEIGMPFSDPVADGPVIQAAGQRALQGGADMRKTLEIVRAFRQEHADTPVILMGYANPVFAYGMEKFAEDADRAGADGLIIVDLPPEEDKELYEAAQKHGLALIRLITATTDENRLKTLLERASGFLYYVAVTGVTGGKGGNMDDIKPHLEMIRKHSDLPVVAGFGIKTPEEAARMGRMTDGIVVGSALVKTIEDNSGKADLKALLSKQVAALAGAL